MNLSDCSGFSGFPGFLEMASSHPDKLHVQKDENLTLKEEIEKSLKNLKYIETPECRAIMDKDIIESKRKEYTMVFKTLLTLKERQNTIKLID